MTSQATDARFGRTFSLGVLSLEVWIDSQHKYLQRRGALVSNAAAKAGAFRKGMRPENFSFQSLAFH